MFDCENEHENHQHHQRRVVLDFVCNMQSKVCSQFLHVAPCRTHGFIHVVVKDNRLSDWSLSPSLGSWWKTCSGVSLGGWDRWVRIKEDCLALHWFGSTEHHSSFLSLFFFPRLFNFSQLWNMKILRTADKRFPQISFSSLVTKKGMKPSQPPSNGRWQLWNTSENFFSLSHFIV